MIKQVIAAAWLGTLATGCSGDLGEPKPFTDESGPKGVIEGLGDDANPTPDDSLAPAAGELPSEVAGGTGNEAPSADDKLPDEEAQVDEDADAVAVPAADPLDLSEPVTCDAATFELGSAPLRRLTGREYLHTLEALFPDVNPELPELPTEAPVDSFDNDALALGPSAVAVARWEEIASRYADAVASDDERLVAFLPCAADVDDRASALACGDELIDTFGTRTHRAALSAAEQERYQGLFATQLDAIDFEAAVQLTMMAMLQSPGFLYRIENTTDADGDAAQLDAFSVASRLSYLFWQNMPDAALLDSAASGALLQADELERQVVRMLSDERAGDALVDFHRQWLYFDRILKEEHDTRVPDQFPDWTGATQTAAREELSRFVRRVVFENRGTFRDLLLSTDAEVNAELAEIYGVDGPNSNDEWETITLPSEERAGLLTRVGFLAAHAHSANGSPPLRGSYVMNRIFCLPPASPPADADTSEPYAEGQGTTNRELFEERVAPAQCQGCHTVIDGFGFAFEHYDAIGGYRDIDNGAAVDASVTLSGTDIEADVDGALELSQVIADSEQVAQCVTGRLLRYAVGRSLESADACLFERLLSRFNESDGNFQDMLVELATSREFQTVPRGTL